MSIEYDSRKVKQGSTFVAISGEKSDGHDFIEQSIQLGASKIVASSKRSESLLPLIEKYKTVEFVLVEDTRHELARLVSLATGNPSEKLKVLGITGTNGKTTVTHLVQGIFSRENKIALLGTMGLKESLESPYHDLSNTTPQSKEIQEIMQDLLKKNYDYLTMEVSSHAVDQKRTAYIKFKAFAVTNLTQDHLDYHLNMDNYFKAKATALKQVSDYVLLNADDEYYERFKAEADILGLQTISISINSEADYKAQNIKYSARGLSYELYSGSNKILNVSLKLNGTFNVYNSMFSILFALQEGIEVNKLEKILPELEPVAGRFELIQSGSSPMCIVDYAHSPDGLENVLHGARELLSEGARLICLFGCGGDRDITKRPKMAKIAYELSDYVFISSDNPRTEDPEQIVADILTGIPEMSKVKVIIDRKEAIKEAIRFSRQEDIVVIAGKGHEDYQIIGETKIHFDDREEVRKVLVS